MSSGLSLGHIFEHLVFDLDDTLLDTSRQLVPRASKEACEAMIREGLRTSVQHCLAAWTEHAAHHSRRDLFTHLVGYFGVSDDADPSGVARRGYHAFYNRKVESDISLFEGARELLIELHGKYCLHLVTQGSKPTQEEKIRILDIRALFESVHHVDPTRGDRKRNAFTAIQAQSAAAPEKHLSIGNRIDTDIAEAIALGWKTCWVRYGEYVAMIPSGPTEQPDYTIESILELRSACQL